MTVDNPSESDACVKGTFVYQRKNSGGEWSNTPATPLSALKAGEGVRLELHANELLQLYKALGALYDNFSEAGIPRSRRRYHLVDAQSSLSDLLEIVRGSANLEVMRSLINWTARQDNESLAQLLGDDSELSGKLDNAVGISRLVRFLAEADRLLERSDEGDWQDLLKRESWALGQIYAQPVVIVDEQVYVGGKDIHGQGGNVADFLYKNSVTDNCLVVEIKRSDTELLVRDKHVRNNTWNISPHLSGAVQQVLQNHHGISESYDELTKRGADFKVYKPRILLIIGSSSKLHDDEMRRNFELYRDQMRSVEIVLFDEMVDRARSLLKLLRSD